MLFLLISSSSILFVRSIILLYFSFARILLIVYEFFFSEIGVVNSRGLKLHVGFPEFWFGCGVQQENNKAQSRRRLIVIYRACYKTWRHHLPQHHSLASEKTIRTRWSNSIPWHHLRQQHQLHHPPRRKRETNLEHHASIFKLFFFYYYNYQKLRSNL